MRAPPAIQTACRLRSLPKACENLPKMVQTPRLNGPILGRVLLQDTSWQLLGHLSNSSWAVLEASWSLLGRLLGGLGGSMASKRARISAAWVS